MSPSNTAFSFFSLLSFLLVLIPLPWHLEAWNTGTLLYMFWTALGSLIFFINSIIWRNDAINWAPVWCDISSKLIIGVTIAIPTASLCINRRLYSIAAVRSVTRTRAEKRRAILSDLAVGLGIPIIVMVLHTVVQGHRFNIFEEIGCFPFTYNTALAYVLVSGPSLAVGLVSGVYSVLSIIAFRRRQTEFKEILSSTSNLNSSRYFRLMALAGMDVLFSVPLSLSAIIINATGDTVQPWVSWEDTHWGFSRVDQFPSILWKASARSRNSLEMTRWLTVICGIAFFLFFGFADEAQKHYKLAYASVVKKVGISTSSGSMTKVGTTSASIGKFGKGGSSTLNASQPGFPIYVSQEIMEKRDSFDTMSDLTSIRDDFEADAASKPSSPFGTLTKTEAAVHQESRLNGSTVTMAEKETNPAKFPSSVTPSGSFLDLSDRNANNV